MTSSVEASAPMGTGETKVDADGLADLDELDDLDIPLGEAVADYTRLSGLLWSVPQ
eukprot:COSAG02_NODE_12777_length_1496_cov_1.484610_2_plen_56_part_00